MPFNAVGIFSVCFKMDISIFLSCISPLHICLLRGRHLFSVRLKSDFFTFLSCTLNDICLFAVGIFLGLSQIEHFDFSKVRSPMHLCLFRGRHLFLSVSNRTFLLFIVHFNDICLFAVGIFHGLSQIGFLIFF